MSDFSNSAPVSVSQWIILGFLLLMPSVKNGLYIGNTFIKTNEGWSISGNEFQKYKQPMLQHPFRLSLCNPFDVTIEITSIHDILNCLQCVYWRHSLHLRSSITLNLLYHKCPLFSTVCFHLIFLSSRKSLSTPSTHLNVISPYLLLPSRLNKVKLSLCLPN
jgi:hypothetical protein